MSKKLSFGFANSMFQSSGLHCGDSNWTEAARKGTVPRAAPSLSHWNNILADLDLMQDVGIDSYRISMEWSHIEPRPGEYDHAVIEQYQQLIDGCLERNINPMITLYHFNEPLWFTLLGGFEKEENIAYYLAYCAYVFPLFSSKVVLWCTMNEPAIQAFMGHFLGDFPPHKHDLHLMAMVLKNLLKAHVDVYHMLKLLPHGREVDIGIVHNVLRFKALYRWDPIAYVIARWFTPMTHHLVFNFFKTGVFTYRVPFLVDVHYQDKRAMHANDFIGLNFYANAIVGPNWINGYGATCRADQVMGEMSLPIDPKGFSDAIDEMVQLNRPIYITETGIADHSDQLRQQLVKQYLTVIREKRRDGVDIRGCYFWAPWDNYEWDHGDTKSFGFFDAHRQPRDSVFLLKQLIAEQH